MKICCRCGVEKSYGEFQAMRSGKDGKRPECKECSAKAALGRYNANPDKFLERKKIWYQKYKDRVIEQHREYRHANKERVYEMTHIS